MPFGYKYWLVWHCCGGNRGRDSAIYCRSDSTDVAFGEFNARWTAAFSGGKSSVSVFHIVSISTRSYW